LSSDCDLNKIGALIKDAGFGARLVDQRSILFESFDIYELSMRMMRDDPIESQ
jgi:hypothetical protein